MRKKYCVTLTREERQALLNLLAAGKELAQKMAHARILLKADQGPSGSAWPDNRIAEALELSIATVERVRQRFVRHGLEVALGRKKQVRPSRQRKLDAQSEDRLITLARSPAPAGRICWTLQLLADRLVELRVVNSISYETIRQVLIRRGQQLGTTEGRRSPARNFKMGNQG